MPQTTSQALVRAQSDDEIAYDRAHAEIAVMRRRILKLQGDRNSIRRALSRFEIACHARVGDLLDELRRVRRAIADQQRRLAWIEEDLDRDPSHGPEDDLPDDDDPVGSSPFDGRATGDADDRISGGNVRRGASRCANPKDEAEAKRLYRELAKRCHPDIAPDEGERERRAGLMQRINEAYRARDLRLLRLIRREAETSDPNFSSRPLSERLAWIQEDRDRFATELAEIQAEVIALQRSELYRLCRRHEAGQQVMDELEDDLERRLREEGRRLDDLSLSYRTAIDERQAATPAAD